MCNDHWSVTLPLFVCLLHPDNPVRADQDANHATGEVGDSATDSYVVWILWSLSGKTISNQRLSETRQASRYLFVYQEFRNISRNNSRLNNVKMIDFAYM